MVRLRRATDHEVRRVQIKSRQAGQGSVRRDAVEPSALSANTNPSSAALSYHEQVPISYFTAPAVAICSSVG